MPTTSPAPPALRPAAIAPSETAARATMRESAAAMMRGRILSYSRDTSAATSVTSSSSRIAVADPHARTAHEARHLLELRIHDDLEHAVLEDAQIARDRAAGDPDRGADRNPLGHLDRRASRTDHDQHVAG